jgi:hypothetical protein
MLIKFYNRFKINFEITILKALHFYISQIYEDIKTN